MPILATQNLSYQYSPNTPFEITAMQDVSIAIEEGRFVSIIGHTGSGKSTLVQHLNGLLKPTSGEVLLDGKSIWAPGVKIRDIRFQVGLCFQYPEHQLFEETVYKDIAFGPKNMGLTEEEIDRRILQAAELIGLKTELLQKSPFDLSGGEKRRAAIAGVMAMQPKVLILDEPTAGLDPKGKDLLLSRLKELQQQTGQTVVIVSHNMEDVAKISDGVYVMNQSRVVMSGSVEEVFSHGEELVKMGLNIPQVTRVFMGLKARGIPVSSNAYTLEQGEEQLLRLWRQRGGGAQ